MSTPDFESDTLDRYLTDGCLKSYRQQQDNRAQKRSWRNDAVFVNIIDRHDVGSAPLMTAEPASHLLTEQGFYLFLF